MRDNYLRSFLRNYLAAIFFYDFIFAYAIYTVLFNMKGLSVFQITILLAWWSFVVLVLEIPTGVIADKWSRSRLLIIAPVIKALCFLSWFLADGNFFLYALGFMFWGLGGTLASGTSESLLYDTLVFTGKSDEYERILGRREFWYKISIGISMITGGFIAHYNMDWAVVFSIAPLILSAIFASMLRDAPRTESSDQTQYFEIIKIAYQEIRTSKILVYLFIYMLGVSVLYNLEELDQLYYQLAGLPVFAFGIVGFLTSLLGALSAFHAYRFKHSPLVLCLFPAAIACMLFLLALFPSIPIILLLMLCFVINSPLGVLNEAKIQHSIVSLSRATITSANSLLLNLFGIFLVLIFGVISRIWNLQAIYVSASILLFCFAIWVFLSRKILVAKSNEQDSY